MIHRMFFSLAAAFTLLPGLVMSDVPRTADGKPDLSGTYYVATVTPLERPEQLCDTLTLSREQAEQMAARIAAFQAAQNQASDPNRSAPPAGGDGSGGPSGNVGGYNAFWIDAGEAAIMHRS